MESIIHYLIPIIPPVCVPSLKNDGLAGLAITSLTDPFCRSAIISLALSYGILLGAMIVNIPQISNLYRSKNAKGIVPAMFYGNAFIYATSAFANWVNPNTVPFTEYGESFILLFTTLFLIYLVHKYQNRLNSLFFISMIIFLSACIASGMGYISFSILETLQGLSLPVLVLSRTPQVFQNFKTQYTGSLSFSSFLLNSIGSYARVYTTLQGNNELINLLSALIASGINTIILFQILWYGSSKSSSTSSSKPKVE